MNPLRTSQSYKDGMIIEAEAVLEKLRTSDLTTYQQYQNQLKDMLDLDYKVPVFKTVDQLVISFINENRDVRLQPGETVETLIVEHIARFESPILLNVLKKKSNVHSKYDVSIIDIINHLDELQDTHKQILKIYNKRK